jgi:CheY-like chemotaxis protein
MAQILFIDDDTITLDLMDKVARLLGHEAILSSSGHAALEAVERHHPDLILVDYNLPDCDGIEITRSLRKKTIVNQTPIFILSAGVPTQMNERARQAGAQGCLEKPLGLDTLARVINTYIRPSL